MKAYHNTVKITDKKELKAREKRAKSQEQEILSLFQRTQKAFGPSQVWQRYRDRWPLTSVRARISTLTKRGRLRMTGQKRKGYYGDPENVWQYKAN